MTSTKSNFKWTDEAVQAFEKVRGSLVTLPVIAFSDFEKPFVVETDASSVAVGAVLSRKKKTVRSIRFSTQAERSAQLKEISQLRTEKRQQSYSD